MRMSQLVWKEAVSQIVQFQTVKSFKGQNTSSWIVYRNETEASLVAGIMAGQSQTTKSPSPDNHPIRDVAWLEALVMHMASWCLMTQKWCHFWFSARERHCQLHDTLPWLRRRLPVSPEAKMRQNKALCSPQRQSAASFVMPHPSFLMEAFWGLERLLPTVLSSPQNIL